MKPELFVHESDASRELLRALPDHERLTLIGRLATDYGVRMGEARDSVMTLGDSVGA